MKNSKLTIIFSFLTLFIFTSISAQIQLGSDIDGALGTSLEGGLAGSSVSLSADGQVVAIGAPWNDDGGIRTGHVQVYKITGGTWIQEGGNIMGEADFDNFGSATAISANGSRVAIGAFQNGGNGLYAGHVRVYEFINGSWIQLGDDIDGDAEGDFFGWSLALSADGSRVVIGAPRNDNNGSFSGQVKVLDWNGTSWEQSGTDIYGDGPSDGMGRSVTISADGNRIAAGAPFIFPVGEVKVFDWDGANWAQVGETIQGEIGLDYFGTSSSLSSDGTRIAIGAKFNSDNGLEEAGHVRIFEWDATEWNQMGEDIDGENAGDELGTSVSMSGNGNRVAIGAPGKDGNGLDSGQAKLHEWNGSSWIQIGEDINGEASNDRSARSVSLSDDGGRIAVGAYLNDGSQEDSGHTRIYQWGVVPVNNILENNVDIYPNPVKEKLHIQGFEFETLEIIDCYGKVVLSKSTNEKEIDVSGLPSGLYLMQVKSKSQEITKQFVKIE